MKRKLSAHRRRQNWEAEQRQKRAGVRKRTIRMHPTCDAILERLQQAYACTVTDVIEGLLLGTIAHNAQRLSPSEVEFAESIGVSL